MTDELASHSAESNTRALLVLLAEGPGKLVEQVGCVLSISQQIKDTPAAKPAPPRQLTTEEARVRSLTAIAEQLREDQLHELYETIQALDDAETRLLANARLALLLPPHYFQAIIRDIWSQSVQLAGPDVVADVMFQLTPLLTLAYDEPAAPTILLEIVSIAQAIGNVEARIRSLLILAPYLPHSMRFRVLHRVLDEIDRLHNDTPRANALCALAEQLSPEIDSRTLHSAESIQQPAERARAITALARHLPLQPELRRQVLDTIESIADEETRADALMAFAPHLEYVTDSDHFPVLLEQALAIAIGIKRRHLRARALVALAPHLTLDLQGEALAAVHGLSSERERSMMLAALAPHLPANMLVASLAVAHSIETQDARVHALTVLARYVPESAQEQTVLDALAAASNLAHHYERVDALHTLIDILPPHLQDQTQRTALDTALLIDNQSARARALSILGPGLPAQLRQQALENALQIEAPDHRLTALTGLVGELNGEQQQQAAQVLLDTIRDLPFEYRQAQAMGEIAGFLTAAMRAEALQIAQEMADPVDQITAYIALAPHLLPTERQTWLRNAWVLLKEVDGGYDAASALSTLAPLLPAAAADDVAKTAGMIIGSIMDEYDQASAIALLAPLLTVATEPADEAPPPDQYAALEKGVLATFRVSDPATRLSLLEQGATLWAEISETDQSYRLWQQTMQHLAGRPLTEAILCLGKLTPVVEQLAGPETMAQIARLLEEYATLPVAESQQER